MGDRLSKIPDPRLKTAVRKYVLLYIEIQTDFEA